MVAYRIISQDDIPGYAAQCCAHNEESKMYYVTMTDKFMSGWGPARDKINKLVISCTDYTEALIVQANAQGRDEMIYVNIRHEKPYYPARRYYVSRHGRVEGDYESCFKPGYFA